MDKKKIVIIGGPASGKTTVCSILRGLTNKNAVTFIEEAATCFFKTISFRKLKKLSPVDLQSKVYDLQLAMESDAEKLDTKLIICDRGATDAYVYCKESDAFRITHCSIEDLLNRYDAVIILEAAESNFKDTETLRLEHSYETVTLLARKSNEVWSKHPNHFRVPQQDTVEKKAELVAKIINEIAGNKIFNTSLLLV